jgi:predicted kinase
VADLLVVTGPPGAGKSTVAAQLVTAFSPAALVSGDAFFAFWTQGAIPPWLPEAHAQNEVVTRAAAGASGAFATGGCTVVYDGVLGPWSWDGFAAAAGVGEVHWAVLLPPLAQCLQRVAARTGHGFTDPAATRHMHEDFAGASIDARHVVPDPGDSAERVATEVLARYRAGSLRRGRG